MASIEELVPKLKSEAEKEQDMFSGDKEREFFIELMEVGSLDELLKLYDPDTHNQKWDAERQKRAPNLDVLMKNRRAIDFMSAGRLGVYRHYKEDELRSHVQGIARMLWNQNCLEQTKTFATMDSIKRA